MGNTLSPYELQKALKELEGKSVYIDCIAKNFETLEPGASFRVLRNFLTAQYQEEANRENYCYRYKRKFIGKVM